MASAFLSLPSICASHPNSRSYSTFAAQTGRRRLVVCSSSSLETPSSVVEELKEESGGLISDTNFKGCRTCGKEEIENGCNGEGRIQGGIATVPGFGWWPIKAYRPCPGFIASGGRYKRYGQSMDEVVSGTSRKVAQKGKKNTQR